jgi:hypothetical protein
MELTDGILSNLPLAHLFAYRISESGFTKQH